MGSAYGCSSTITPQFSVYRALVFTIIVNIGVGGANCVGVATTKCVSHSSSSMQHSINAYPIRGHYRSYVLAPGAKYLQLQPFCRNHAVSAPCRSPRSLAVEIAHSFV